MLKRKKNRWIYDAVSNMNLKTQLFIVDILGRTHLCIK